MKKTKISQNDIQEKWYLVDVAGQRIGNVATTISQILMGKTDPKAQKHLNPKSYVVVVNAGKIDFSPKRGFSKFYKTYSGFPGGLRYTDLDTAFAKDKGFPIWSAVKGMLPKTKRGDEAIVRLKIFDAENHDHEAQKPQPIDLKNYKI